MSPEEKKRERDRRYRERNRCSLRARGAARYAANKDAIRSQQAEYYAANKDAIRAKQKERYEATKAEYVDRANRRQRALDAHPSWDPEFDELVISEAYALVQLRQVSCPGTVWHLDHTVPLKHRNACGLHNGWNLQVVPASWNLRKGNRNMALFFPIGNFWDRATVPTSKSPRSGRSGPHLTKSPKQAKSRLRATA